MKQPQVERELCGNLFLRSDYSRFIQIIGQKVKRLCFLSCRKHVKSSPSAGPLGLERWWKHPAVTAKSGEVRGRLFGLNLTS